MAAVYPAYDPVAAATRQRRKVMAFSALGLAAFLGWQAQRVGSYNRSDTRPPAWDQSIHLEIAHDYAESVREGRWRDLLHPTPKPGMPAFPPLYHLALLKVASYGDPAKAALWVNYVYFVALTLCLFGLVFEFRSDLGALAATLGFVCAPAVQELLYTQLVDLPLIACSAAAYWAFVRSEEFSEWAPSLAFGALFAAGMLHKWSFFSYMIPAYYVGIKALGDRRRRGPALGALFAALALFGPWYAANWPLLIPRLIQASADFAVPVWQGGAFFVYLLASLETLGPLLWIMGWIGLLVPQFRRREDDGWLIPFWVVSSYVFWAIVPNRQFRFLIPGLPGLAVAACGSWPKPMIWSLAAVQLFLAANFTGGWLGPIDVPLPGSSFRLFPNHPPAQENWRVDEILKEAQSRHDGATPVANLTLIANHPSFNGPHFTWRRKFLELPHVRLRGVNRRLCESSEFVVLKTGNLGPPGVIDGLPEAAALVQDPGGWFSRAYEKVGQWTLPDDSQAVLFQRLKLNGPPFKAAGPVKFQYYDSGAFAASDLTVDLGSWDARQGAYPRLRLDARQVELRGLRIENAGIELEQAMVVPVYSGVKEQWRDVRLIRLKSLRIRSARISADNLKAFLEARINGLKLDHVSINGAVSASGRFRGVPVSAEVSAKLQEAPKALRLKIVSLRLGPNPLPVEAINRIKELTVSLDANPETPFPIDFPGLTLRDGALTIP